MADSVGTLYEQLLKEQLLLLDTQGNEDLVEVIWAWDEENTNPALTRFLETVS
jgi:hypothetical protein